MTFLSLFVLTVNSRSEELSMTLLSVFVSTVKSPSQACVIVSTVHHRPQTLSWLVSRIRRTRPVRRDLCDTIAYRLNSSSPLLALLATTFENGCFRYHIGRIAVSVFLEFDKSETNLMMRRAVYYHSEIAVVPQ